MHAYKLKGKVDDAGNLVIAEPINLPSGDVEIIVLQAVETVDSSIKIETELQPAKPKRKVECSIPILKEWLEKTEPAPPDFDPDRAKWEYLKEKHNL
jgi:hypothetical protein